LRVGSALVVVACAMGAATSSAFAAVEFHQSKKGTEVKEAQKVKLIAGLQDLTIVNKEGGELLKTSCEQLHAQAKVTFPTLSILFNEELDFLGCKSTVEGVAAEKTVVTATGCGILFDAPTSLTEEKGIGTTAIKCEKGDSIIVDSVSKEGTKLCESKFGTQEGLKEVTYSNVTKPAVEIEAAASLTNLTDENNCNEVGTVTYKGAGFGLADEAGEEVKLS
jgi:hypothetical protein